MARRGKVASGQVRQVRCRKATLVVVRTGKAGAACTG
jgi:hypothetical protein